MTEKEDRNQLLAELTEGYYHLLMAYKAVGGKETTGQNGRGFLRETSSNSSKLIHSAISSSYNELHVTVQTELINPILVSQGALEKFSKQKEDKTNSPVNLKSLEKQMLKMNYNDLKSTEGLNDTNRKNPKFQWEHAHSRATFTKNLTMLVEEEKEDIMKAIYKELSEHQIVIITEEENKRINAVPNGKYDRVRGWLKIYEDANVHLSEESKKILENSHK